MKKKILIGGNWWDIKEVSSKSKLLNPEDEDPPDGTCWSGATHPYGKIIAINKDHGEKPKLKTFLHKTIHAISIEYIAHPYFRMLAADETSEEVETAIDILAGEILSVLRQTGLVKK